MKNSYRSDKYADFSAGGAAGETVGLQYLIQQMSRFGFSIDEEQFVMTLEQMGYDRDSEVLLAKAIA